MAWNCYQCGNLLESLEAKPVLKGSQEGCEALVAEAISYKSYQATFKICRSCGAEYLALWAFHSGSIGIIQIKKGDS